MRNSLLGILLVLFVMLLGAGCATSPEAESRRMEKEEEIAAILSEPLDPEEFGKTKRCLSDHEVRSFRAIDDRRLLFEGRRGRLWLNTLRSRCTDLRYADVLRVRSITSTRICSLDRFQAGDWFDWPWYRRWPWRWGGTWSDGIPCTFGEFQPVTSEQVAEIEAVLRSR